MYTNLPSFDQMFKLLSENGFLLVSLYPFAYQDNFLSWTDALFVNEYFYAEHAPKQVESP